LGLCHELLRRIRIAIIAALGEGGGQPGSG
jgi:hypothetical protein